MSTQQEAQERAKKYAYEHKYSDEYDKPLMIDAYTAGEASGERITLERLAAKCEFGNWYEAYMDEEKTSYIIPDYKIRRFDRRESELLARIELQDKRIAELEKVLEMSADLHHTKLCPCHNCEAFRVLNKPFNDRAAELIREVNDGR